MASKSIHLGRRIRRDQLLDRRVDPQRHRAQRAQEVNDIPAIDQHLHLPPATPPTLVITLLPTEEATHKPFDARVMLNDLACRGVEALSGAQGVLARLEHNVEERREDVRKGQDAEGGNDRGETAEVGDAGADDVRDGPVDGDQRDPGELPVALSKWRRGEELHGDVVVEDFDTDVAVERGSDPVDFGQ